MASDSYTLRFKNSAAKEFRGLSGELKQRGGEAIDRLSLNLRSEGIVKLQVLAELRVARERGDRAAECNALGNLGIGYDQQQRWQEALERLTEYLNLTRELFYG